MEQPMTDASGFARVEYLLRRLARVFPSRELQRQVEEFLEQTADRHGN
jgi:hypothetical protein